MRIIVACAAAILATGLASGCFEGKADLTLNPDGSGRIVCDLTFPALPPWTGPAATAPATKAGPKGGTIFPTATPTTGSPKVAKTPEDEMKDVCYRFLKQSQGIDAWKDVSFERLAGSIHFKGTAYFKDLSKVQFYPDKVKTRMGFGPAENGDLMLVLNKPVGPDDSLAPKAGISLTADDVIKQMKTERDSYHKAKGDLALEMMDMKLNLIFRLPGVAAPVKGLVEEDGACVMRVDGLRLLQSLDGPMADNIWLRKRIFSGQTLGAQPVTALKKYLDAQVFAYKGEAWARVSGDVHKQFDYAAEADAAKKAYPDMLVKLGLEKPKPVTATPTNRPASTTTIRSTTSPTATARPSGGIFTPPPTVPVPAKPPALPGMPASPTPGVPWLP
jgi:hypothetical protein